MRVMDVDGLIGWDHAARVIWNLLDDRDLSRFEEGIRSRQEEAGRPCWPPQLLISIWLYGYSLGVASARALSRMMDHEPGLRWLSADQEINHHTLSDFRVRHAEALKGLFTQVLAAMEEEGLLDLSTLVQDGTKIRAVAGRQSMHRERTLRQRLQQAGEVVEQLSHRAESDSDRQEPRVEAAQQRAARERVARLKAAVEELAVRQAEVAESRRAEVRVSESEAEARKMKHADGSWAPSYNVQVTTEPKSRVIVSVDVTTDANDTKQLQPAVERFHDNTGRLPERVIADNGYATRENVEVLSAGNIEMIAPWKPDASRQAGANAVHGCEAAFSGDQFQSNGDKGLVCPAGCTLVHIGVRKHHGSVNDVYEAKAEDCLACIHRTACCGNTGKARRIMRVRESDAMQEYLARMQQPEARQLYKLRCAVAEFPHLIVKARWKWTRFSVRGQTKARIEAIWVALAYNMRQWIGRKLAAGTVMAQAA